MRIWEAPADIKHQVDNIKVMHHPHLAHANIWVLVADSKPIKDNKLVITKTAKCTNTEHLENGKDFKIIITAEAWSSLPDAARAVALDEALCRCGVKYVPATIEVNGRKEVLKDDIGRIIYTNEIDYDKEGRPKWKMNAPDASTYFALVKRHGMYGEDLQNLNRVLNGQEIITPTAATQEIIASVDEINDSDEPSDGTMDASMMVDDDDEIPIG